MTDRLYIITLKTDFYDPPKKENQEKMAAGQAKNAEASIKTFAKDIEEIDGISFAVEYNSLPNLTTPWGTIQYIHLDEKLADKTIDKLRALSIVETIEPNYGDLPKLAKNESKKDKADAKKKDIKDFLK